MSFGFTEALMVAGVVIALFGLGKLPTVMGDLAKGIRTFKDEMRSKDEVRGDGDRNAPGGTPGGSPGA